MSEAIAAVILAGGLGTRLRSVLPDLPKPMAPVAGRPFVEWVVRFLAKQGIRDVTISTGYKAEAFASHFAHTILDGVSVACVPEPQPLGTAGGFLYAATRAENRPEAWLVLNGDSLVLTNLALLFRTLAAEEVASAILALWMGEAARYGSLKIGDDDRLLNFLEKRPGPSWVNAGVYLVRDSLLTLFPENRPLSWEKGVFPHFLSAGNEIRACKTRAPFLDIGTPESLAQAGDFIRSNSNFFLDS